MKSFVLLSMLGLAAAASERILERLPPFMSQPTDRIIDGHPITEREQAPWIGSLVDTYYGPGHFCGCSVIDEWHILTAGHCVFPSSPQDYIIYLGFAHYDTSDSYVQQRGVAAIRRHPQYSASSLKNDIAILKLTEPLQFNEYVKPVLLPDYGLEEVGEGDKMNVLGWGVTSVGANQASENLMAAEVIYNNDLECVQNYSSVYPVYTCGMCCASAPGRDSCQGDSGGPLVLAYGELPMPYQVGIVSWGYGCASAGYPGVYTKVSKYLGWIRTCAYNIESGDCINPHEEYVC